MASGVPAGGLAFRAGMVYTGCDCQMGKDLLCMNGITAIVCCYNEEKRLADTLKSLSAYDEDVVLDKYSPDRSM